MGALLIDVFENNEIYTLSVFFIGQGIYFNLFLRYMWHYIHYIQLQTESVAFILIWILFFNFFLEWFYATGNKCDN